MCDFGISGYLVDSVAKTVQAGCKPYMAPERIDPKGNMSSSYGIRSDVWSLGISILEVACGKFPYNTNSWATPFDQLKQVVLDDPPRLPVKDSSYSDNLFNFIETVLVKKYDMRPNYPKLLEHPFIVAHTPHQNVTFAKFIAEIFPPEVEEEIMDQS